MTYDRIPDRPVTQALPQMALTLGAFLLAVVLGKTLFFPWLHRYLAVPDPAEAARHARAFFYGFGTVLAFLALWPAWAGVRMWRETPILRGGAAAQRALALFICALLLLACAAVALTIPARFATRHPRQAAQPVR